MSFSTKGRGVSRRLIVLASVLLAVAFGAAFNLQAIVLNLGLVGTLHEPQAEHVDQEELYDLVVAGDDEEAFEDAFEDGDELFETVFNALDGIGANVGQGFRFSRVPRADLNGPGEWANHTPLRATGPNAEACNHCHNNPTDDGSGAAFANVHRDPTGSAVLSQFITRNTPHLFSPGSLQRLAEEMTSDLQGDRHDIAILACIFGHFTANISAKGVPFGHLTVNRVQFFPCKVTVDTSGLDGVDDDLVVRPFQWKGVVASVRDFNRGASHNELGMQAVEIVGDGVDGDFDSVVDEMTIGDQTALAVYLASQPRPVTELELDNLGLIELSNSEKSDIIQGRNAFFAIDCDDCHRETLKINNTIFSEPSQHPDFRDAVFPAGQDPVSRFVDPQFPVTFDLTEDQPDNRIEVGGQIVKLGSLQKDSHGRGIVHLYGDLKRHDMGPGLAESVDEVGTGASVWITKELWGVGSTAPYLHDGRATTLTEAILEHGGEAASSRNQFQALSTSSQRKLIRFLNNLVLFKAVAED